MPQLSANLATAHHERIKPPAFDGEFHQEQPLLDNSDAFLAAFALDSDSRKMRHGACRTAQVTPFILRLTLGLTML